MGNNVSDGGGEMSPESPASPNPGRTTGRARTRSSIRRPSKSSQSRDDSHTKDSSKIENSSSPLRRVKTMSRQAADLRPTGNSSRKKMMGTGLMRVVMGGGIRYGLLLDRTGSKGKSKGKLVIFWAGKLPDESDAPSNNQLQEKFASDAIVDPNDINLFDVRKLLSFYNTHSRDLRMSITLDNSRIEGFVQVHLNLLNPISVRKSSSSSLTVGGGASDFSVVYLNDMTKRLHIDSSTTALDIITLLMERYDVVDDPRNFALFECKGDRGGIGGRRLGDEEQPLLLSLIWGPMPSRSLSLQELSRKRSGTLIQWESFSMPELQNFLVMLEREEKNHFENIKLKYEEKRKRIERLLEKAGGRAADQ